MNSNLQSWEKIRPSSNALVIAPEPQPRPSFAYASLRERALAHAIDATIVHGFSLYLSQLLTILSVSTLAEIYRVDFEKNLDWSQSVLSYWGLGIWAASFVSLSFFYVVFCTHAYGRTIGKALFGLRVVDEKGYTPSLRQATTRYALYYLTYASFGLSFVLYSAIKRGPSHHDSWSQTWVIRDRAL